MKISTKEFKDGWTVFLESQNLFGGLLRINERPLSRDESQQLASALEIEMGAVYAVEGLLPLENTFAFSVADFPDEKGEVKSDLVCSGDLSRLSMALAIQMSRHQALASMIIDAVRYFDGLSEFI
jgi:hypothetical protein